MQPLTTLIFDFDGTLMDTSRSLQNALMQTLSELKHPLPVDTYELTCQTTEDLFRSVGLTDATLHARAVARFQELHLAGGPHVRLFPEVAATLALLSGRGYRMAIATNEIRALLDPLTATCGIDHFFETSICADEVAQAKPSPEMIEQICARLRCRPGDTLMVGDSPLDVAMGQTAGCHTCAVGYGSHSIAQLQSLGPDFIIRSFAEIVDLLPPAAQTV